MIDHTGLNVSDPQKSREFYRTALAPLGYKILNEVPAEFTGGRVVIGFGIERADFWMAEGTPHQPRNHIAFRARNRQQVDAFFHAAIAAGGKDNGAFILDPDGYNIEAVCLTR